jgi:serine/threonine-protein kinase
MLIGQQFGPFVIDKELGSGAMGAVYRGRYTKDGRVVAIKVMAPGLGTTNNRAAERFEREAEILKQLRHPHIVRLFGVGTYQRTRYFAMEYIEGESLDKVMARRGRMSWEEVIALGQQLCDALQHAHEKGIIHRDLKPSNLMILRDGTLKLTDFGIAKDMDVTQLTSANCTVGTAAYMSPEQCKGERDLSSKSDLYSMGVLLYELVTGRKPFNAENAMDMFLQHVSGTFERPSRLALELPVWLDTLICQLLEKKPEHRPLDAHMVLTALAGIKEKVEAQRSAGLEAAQKRIIDRMPPGHVKADEKDKETARFLLKGKVRRRRAKKAWHEKIWVRALGLTICLGVVVFTLILALQPPSADELYEKVARVMPTSDHTKQDDALAGPITTYLDRYGGRDDEKTRQVRQWCEQIEMRQGEDLLQRYRKKKRVMDGSEEEMRAFKAIDAEDLLELDTAQERWEYLAREGSPKWRLIAKKRLADLATQAAAEQNFEPYFKALLVDGVDRLPEGKVPQQAYMALRYERFGDRKRAEQRLEEIKEKTAQDNAMNLWFIFAGRKIKELKRRPQERDSLALVEEKLKQARDAKDAPDVRALQAYATCLDILALYSNEDEDEGIKKLVPKARELLEEMANRLGRKLPAAETPTGRGRP